MKHAKLHPIQVPSIRNEGYNDARSNLWGKSNGEDKMYGVNSYVGEVEHVVKQPMSILIKKNHSMVCWPSIVFGLSTQLA